MLVVFNRGEQVVVSVHFLQEITAIKRQFGENRTPSSQKLTSAAGTDLLKNAR